jgi:aminoglycoside phosphotransferase (APT) family kinase protein
VLRSHARALVPEVLALHAATPDFPAEALTMTWIPGVNASKLQFPDEAARRRFVDDAVANLRAWHAVRHDAGFGPLEGPFSGSWLAAYGARVGAWHAQVQAPPHAAVVSPPVRRVLDRSVEAIGAVFGGRRAPAVLVHSDYNAWNLMADPESYALTGVIDPIDAGWADPEIDLFHLPNARPEFGLLERYLEEVAVDARLWLRLRFYRLWDDVKHYLRVGWYQEAYFRQQAELLAAELDQLG